MKIRTKYLLFVATIHLLALLMSYFIFMENKLWFLLSEVVILGSIILSWQLFNQMVRPLKLLVQGAQAISDQDFTVKLVETGTVEMDQLISVYNQMIEELRKERTRQQQQHFFLEKLILNSPVGIIILDHDNRIQQVNPAARAVLRSITPEGWLLSDIDHPIFNEISQMLQNHRYNSTLHGAETYKLQLSEFIDLGFPRHFVVLQELTTELLEAEKMAYGKVIRMMAHEVNNTIGPVNSILQSALSMQEQTAPSGNLTNALQVATDRNNNLNRFMRNLADVVRLPEPNRVLVNMHDMIHAVATLLEATAREKGIRFELFLDNAALTFFADHLQMEQVLINIVKNAIEAIPANTGGKIAFITGYAGRQLIIRDNGRGLDAAVLPQLFSPFFSTKKDGQGIGLTLIKDILIKHNFQFNLENNTAGETDFIIIG